jgi:hypothetical protein
MGPDAEPDTALNPMEAQTDVSAGTGRLDVLVLDVGETVGLQARVDGDELQFEAY